MQLVVLKKTLELDVAGTKVKELLFSLHTKGKCIQACVRSVVLHGSDGGGGSGSGSGGASGGIGGLGGGGGGGDVKILIWILQRLSNNNTMHCSVLQNKMEMIMCDIRRKSFCNSGSHTQLYI